MKKLKHSEIKSHRLELLAQQGYRCRLCAEPLSEEQAVLDHNHKSGEIRGVLHRFCNTFLGKIENNVVRNRISDEQLDKIFTNYKDYVKITTDVLHPTHLTAEQRQQRARKRAQARRKKK
jgi:hypothetical protein